MEGIGTFGAAEHMMKRPWVFVLRIVAVLLEAGLFAIILSRGNVDLEEFVWAALIHFLVFVCAIGATLSRESRFAVVALSLWVGSNCGILLVFVAPTFWDYEIDENVGVLFAGVLILAAILAVVALIVSAHGAYERRRMRSIVRAELAARGGEAVLIADLLSSLAQATEIFQENGYSIVRRIGVAIDSQRAQHEAAVRTIADLRADLLKKDEESRHLSTLIGVAEVERNAMFREWNRGQARERWMSGALGFFVGLATNLAYDYLKKRFGG